MKQNYQIYVHIPFCKARCGYCAFSSCTDFSLVEDYFAKLYKQIEETPVVEKQISTIFIGGGTPSSVPTKYIDGLFECLKNKFDLSAVCEVTVECNPESVTVELLHCLKVNGVNRLSFGLQSVNDATLTKIGRLHTYQQFVHALNLAKNHGFQNINADLILGLPESIDEFKKSIDTVVQLPLKHVSVYALELHKNSAIYQLCNQDYNYDDDTLADMYDYAVQKLCVNGFDRYEISNFAQKGYECKHNLGYWQEQRYYGFGASASGFVGNERYENKYSIIDYVNSSLQDLVVNRDQVSQKEQAKEFVMLGLRLAQGISLQQFQRYYGDDFFHCFANATKLLQQDFLVVQGGRLFVPQDKFYVVNSILCELLNTEERD